jgi:hypothetical protein|tara:strand:+ start:2411 stop:3397 length:987 start_codon:yes stop_codon:yes gene_type:complete
MGFLRKKAKQIGKAIKKVGKKLKKGFGKIAKAFGKLGPIGTIAMSFILPGVGSALTNWLGQFGSSVMKMLPEGMSTFISQVGNTIRTAASGIGDGIKNVFGKITDGIEYGMNKLGSPFGKGDVGSNFRNFLNDLSGDRIGKAEFGTKPNMDTPTVPKISDVSKVDTTGEGLTVDEKLDRMGLKPKKGEESIFDLSKRKDLTAAEKIKLSKEAKTFNRVASLNEFGQDIINQEQTIKLSQERQDQARRDYFTDFGQSSLKYMGVDTLSAQPVSFFDTTSFNTSNDPASNYMKQVYNFKVPTGQNPIKLAMATNTYGYNFMDAIGLTEVS